jgi:Tol biopolymer transport system component
MVARKHLTAPGWTADGNAITYVDYTTPAQTPFIPLRTAAPVAPAVPVVPSAFSYFASKSGETMQIWRKSADGSQSSQFTPDDFNNVAPHLSPDGKYLLVLSYSKVYNKLSDEMPVMLRLMNLKDNTIKTLVSFVGGPESLGDLPWSPDGKRIVFISYQPMSLIRF